MAQDNLAAGVRERFFFPPSWEVLSGPLGEVIDSTPGPLRDLGRAFKRNVLGSVATLSMPFRMAFASVHKRRFQAIHTAERIRARAHLQPDGTVPAWAEEAALKKARQLLDEECQGEDSRGIIIDQTVEELRSSLHDQQLSVAATELLRQGVILTWGSFEVFVRDFFIIHVNSSPELGRELVESDKTKHLFQLKNVPFTVLAEYGFSVQSRLGELLAGQYDLDSIPSMKAVFSVLFPTSAALRTALDDRPLWVLAQRRNLIVHRRGLVDSQYLDATGEIQAAGSELSVLPDEVECYMRSCCEVVRQLLLAAG
jgi:hypothetical protein